jgi:membrane protein DedA with SNARE-associated domain
MLNHLILSIINWTVRVISASGYVGVAGLMAIESAAIPIPSEVVMPFAGSLVSSGRFTLLGLALAGAVGSLIGSLFMYTLGRIGGRPLVERYGRYIFISRHDLDKSDRFFGRFGAYASFIGRVLPVVRTYISIPAGVSRTPVVPFALTSFIGSFIWCYFLAYVGQQLGSHWENLHERFKYVPYVIALVILLLIANHIRTIIKQRRAGIAPAKDLR